MDPATSPNGEAQDDTGVMVTEPVEVVEGYATSFRLRFSFVPIPDGMGFR